MKKFLSTICILAGLAGTAQAAPYVLPSEQPGALTSYDWQPVYGIEALYGIAAGKTDIDTVGFRASFSMYDQAIGNFRHQFSVNVAPQWGSETHYYDFGSYKMDAFLMPMTIGYDLHIEVVDNAFLYLCGKAGIAYGNFDGPLGKYSSTDFTYSVGAGIKVQASDSIYLKAGYEYGRTYFEQTFSQHIISVGVGVTF